VAKTYEKDSTSKPKLVHVNVRIPEDTLAYFKQFPNYTCAMRVALVAAANKVNLTLLGAVEPVTSTGFYFDKV
jgi:hypothetical protein